MTAKKGYIILQQPESLYELIVKSIQNLREIIEVPQTLIRSILMKRYYFEHLIDKSIDVSDKFSLSLGIEIENIGYAIGKRLKIINSTNNTIKLMYLDDIEIIINFVCFTNYMTMNIVSHRMKTFDKLLNFLSN